MNNKKSNLPEYVVFAFIQYNESFAAGTLASGKDDGATESHQEARKPCFKSSYASKTTRGKSTLEMSIVVRAEPKSQVQNPGVIGTGIKHSSLRLRDMLQFVPQTTSAAEIAWKASKRLDSTLVICITRDIKKAIIGENRL
jgi:hypothetical protein